MTAIYVALITAAMPILFGELGRLFNAIFTKAQPIILKAQADKTLPTGQERHDFVVNTITPELKQSASNILPALIEGAANFATGLAYKYLQKTNKLPEAAAKTSIPPSV